MYRVHFEDPDPSSSLPLFYHTDWKESVFYKLTITFESHNMNRLTIFICFCCVFASCKPNEPEPPPKDLGFVPLPEEVRAMIAFKPGTWWVYKNTLTNELDTVIVEQLQTDTVFRNAVGTGANITYYNGQVSDTTIEGTIYPVLHKFLIDDDDVFPISSSYTIRGGPSIYYWCRNIGIVRIWHFAHTPANIPVYQAWNLVDYHIVQ